MANKPCVPRKLARADVRHGFDSGAPELDEWLERYSWQNQQANNATTYVTARDERVVGYYALAVATVASDCAPVRVARNAPKQVPWLLLARLAVDRSMQGSGLGGGILADALRRTAGLADSVGIRALLVHCRDDEARQFYMSQAEFLESPSDPLQLLLPIKDIVRSLI